MTADLTPAQAAQLEAIEAALHERFTFHLIGRAVALEDGGQGLLHRDTSSALVDELAVAAIDVMRGAGHHAGDLLCTYCGGPLLLEMTTLTRDDTETVDPDNLQCCDVRCGATWETDGTLRMAGSGHLDVMRGATDDGAIGRDHCSTCECIHEPCGYVIGSAGCEDFHDRAAIGAPATADGDDRG